MATMPSVSLLADSESVFAPIDRAQERQAKQNALAAARQQEFNQRAVRNVLASSIDPATGMTNWQQAYMQAPERFRPELQQMQQADIMSQVELRGKRATAAKSEADAAKTDSERMAQAMQTLASLTGASVDESSYQINLQTARDMGFDVSNAPANFDANYVRNQNLAALDAAKRFELQATRERDQATAEYQRGQLGVSQGNLAVNQAAERRAQAAYESSIDPETQRRLAEAKKRGEDAAGKGPAATSAAAAQAFLTSAGYDPETGADEVSKLIPESTGGAVETGLAKTAGAFNITTSGQKAIGQLASRSSKLVLDLLGGKLGAGVSNADREFMLQAVGDIGNSMLPTEVRLAAWNDLMSRMKQAAESAPSARPSPSAAAIQHLLSNPNLAAAFDEKYGAGAAAMYSAKGK